MKTKSIIQTIMSMMILSLFIMSCEENEPRGDEFTWSPDGKKLAMVNITSGELFIVELDGEKMKRMTPIDSGSIENGRIYLPKWSRDGAYLLYVKPGVKALEVWTCKIAGMKPARISQIAIGDKKDIAELVAADWSPVTNRLFWMSLDDQAGYQLSSSLPDGKDRKLLMKLTDQEVFPFFALSPDGEWIAYSVSMQKGHKSNGVWKVKTDGSGNRQIFAADEISVLQWQPDGSHLTIARKVIVQKDQKSESKETKEIFTLSLVDADGKNERNLAKEEKQIVKCAWSPDGRQLAIFQQQDDLQDIWLINLDSGRKVRMNYGKVRDFFGWDSANQFFYTTDFPENVGTENEKDARELFETLRGEMRENVLVKYAQLQQWNQNTNIFAHACGGHGGAVAYYKSAKPNVLGDDTHFPVIEFADGKKIYPACTKEQYVSAADECYLNGRYQDALDCYGRSLNMDLNSAEFTRRFAADALIQRIEVMTDSTKKNGNLEQPGEPMADELDLLRLVLILRRIGEYEKADWLFEQFKKYTVHLLDSGKKENDKKDALNQLIFTTMGIYSRYSEFTSGMSDLDRLKSGCEDSILITFSDYAQSILAMQDKKYEKSLQKMASAIRFLPPSMAELDDMRGLLSLCFANLNENKAVLLVPVLQQAIERFPHNENIYQIHDMLGDVYVKMGKKAKALEAYQTAVALHSDNQEIWKKILDCQM